MALRPIVNFEVDDQPLDRGLQKLQKLHEAAQKFKNDPITLLGKPSGGRGGITEEERAVPFAERLARAWNTMREHSREVVRNVREMAQRFLSLTGWMGLLTGAATAGGALGFGAIARSVSNDRQAALEARTTIGGYRAAQIGLTPLLPNVTGLLPRLADAMQDPASPTAFALKRLGVDPTKAGGDTFRLVTEQLIPKIREWQKTMPEWAQGFQWRAQGLEQIMPFAETRQLSGRTDKEIQDRLAATERMRGQFEMTPQTAQRFQEFMTKLEAAGTAIEQKFKNKIVDLEGPLGRLVGAFTNLVNEALNEANTQKIGRAIDALASWLNSIKQEDMDRFATHVSNFISGIGELTAELYKFVTFLRTSLPSMPDLGTGKGAGIGAAIGGGVGLLGGHPVAGAVGGAAIGGAVEAQLNKPPAFLPGYGLDENWKLRQFNTPEDKSTALDRLMQLQLPDFLQMAPEGTPNPLLEKRKPSDLKTPEERSWWRKYNPFQRSSADELAEQHMKSGDLGGIRYKPAEPQPWLTLQQQQELLAKLYPPKQVSFGGGSAQAFPIYASRPLPVEIVGFRGFGKDKEAPADQPYKGMVQEAAFRTPMNDNILGMIEKYESGGRNIWNWRHAEDPEHFTASGFYQIIDSTWNEAKKRLGVPQSLWPHAMDAPRDVQTMIAEELLRTRGIDPWKSNEPLMRALQGQQAPREPFHPPTRDQVAFTIQNEAGGNLVTTTRRLAVG